MKTRSFVSGIFILLLLLSLSSCRERSIDKKIRENMSNIDAIFEADRSKRLDEYYGDYAVETNYIPTTLNDLEGIYSLDYMFDNDNYYFNVTKRYETANTLGGVQITAYTNLTTGTKHYLCTDPLCTHTEPEECKYLGLLVYLPAFGKGNFYTMDYRNIYKINPNEDTVKVVYTGSKDAIYLEGICNNKLYFYEDKQDYIASERTVKSNYTLCVFDTETEKNESYKGFA